MSIRMITPCLWFADQAEAAAHLYVSVFPNSRIATTTHYGEAGQEITGGKPGSVLTVDFELNGQPFTALNGGPLFTFNEAISLQILCDTQDEIDYYWDKLGAGGDPKAQQCGWLKDRFGVSWQVSPAGMAEALNDPDRARADRVMAAMLKMKKIDIAELKRASEAQP